MYTKTEGYHCWWLNKNGKALANFDNEVDVDDIIQMQQLAIRTCRAAAENAYGKDID